MKRRTGIPELVEDLAGGEIVRVDAGLLRATPLVVCGDRRCIVLRDDLSETRGRIWVAGRTRVLELVQDQGAYEGRTLGTEEDPLQVRR